MSQTAFILAALIIGFIIFVTAKRTLPVYLSSVGL